jgi:hypothetical protein
MREGQGPCSGMAPLQFPLPVLCGQDIIGDPYPYMSFLSFVNNNIPIPINNNNTKNEIKKHCNTNNTKRQILPRKRWNYEIFIKYKIVAI